MRVRALLSRLKRGSILISAGIVVAACAGEREAPSPDTAAAAASPAVGGEPDKEFLGKMIGHHSGMLTMAEAAMASATGQAKSDAEMVHHKQSMERDSMSAILSTRYMTMITPAVSPMARMMTDSLKKLTGAAANHAFYDMTIQHHQEGVAMVDEYLGRLSPEVGAMALAMKTDQTAETAAFQRNAGDAHPVRQ